MGDPVSLTGILISAVAGGCAVVKTAIDIQNAYRQIRVDSLPKLNTDSTVGSLKHDIFKKINNDFITKLEPCELVAVKALSSIYDSYADNAGRFKVSVDVTLVAADADGKFIKVVGTTYMCMTDERSDNDKVQRIKWMIENIRKLKKDERLNTIGVHNCYVVTLDSVPSYTEKIQTEEEYTAIMSLIGEVISKCIDSNYDGRVVKVGFCVTEQVNYLSKINVMIEADWTDAPVTRVIRDIRKIIQDKDADVQKTIDQLYDYNNGIQDRNIILLGESGSGKSHTANMLYKELKEDDAPDVMPFRESGEGACTSGINYALCGINNKTKIWDTPGLKDEYRRDDIFVKKIEDSLVEIGQISVIILCEKTLERKHPDDKEMVKKYASIIGEPMQDRLLVAVNRGQVLITDTKKETEIRELSLNHVRIKKDDIYDINIDPDNQSNSRVAESEIMKKRFISRVKEKLECKPVKVGIMQDLCMGLKKMQEISESFSRTKLKEKLLNISYEVLREEIRDVSKNDELPKVEDVKEHKIVFQKYCNRPSGPYIRRWSLESDKIGTYLERMVKDFLTDLIRTVKDLTVDDALNKLKEKQLVFLKRNKDILHRSDDKGILVKTHVYILVDVSSGLDLSTVQFIDDIIRKKKDKCVNIFTM